MGWKRKPENPPAACDNALGRAFNGGPPPALSPRDVGQQLRVSKDTVLEWIRSGALQAIDVRRPRSSRARYRIPWDALESFKAARCNGHQNAGARTESPFQRNARPAPKTEYF
jgi:excisionase family DNA binding protein